MRFYHAIDALLGGSIVLSIGWVWLLERADRRRNRRERARQRAGWL